MFFLTILKDLLNLHYKKKYEAELRNFFFSEFPMVTAYVNFGGIRDPLKQSGTSILNKPKQRRQ